MATSEPVVLYHGRDVGGIRSRRRAAGSCNGLKRLVGRRSLQKRQGVCSGYILDAVSRWTIRLFST